jgi:hypothetical protein
VLLLTTGIIVTAVCTSNTSLTGGTSIPNQIVGTIYTPGGNPAGGAHVTLMSDSTTNYHLNSVYDSTISDVQGKYKFENVKAGRYSVVATVQDSMFVVKINGIEVSDSESTVRIGDTLVHGGTISGTIRINYADTNLFLQLSNTPFVTRIDNTGAFHFTPVPSGEYLLMAIYKRGYRNQPVLINTDSVRVSTGSETVVDPITTVPLFAIAGWHTLDNFNDSNSINTFSSSWWTFNDAASGGHTIVTPPLGTDFTQAIEVNGANTSTFCCHIKYSFGQTSPCFAGMGCELAPESNGMLQSRDFSKLKSMNVWLKGKGAVSVVFISGINGAENVTLLNVDSLTDSWIKFSVDIDSILTSGNATFSRSWEKTKQNIVQFDIIGTGDSGSDGEFWTDEIEFEFR